MKCESEESKNKSGCQKDGIKGTEERRNAERDICRSEDKRNYSCKKSWRFIGL
jgi:hypothetical protein